MQSEKIGKLTKSIGWCQHVSNEECASLSKEKHCLISKALILVYKYGFLNI